VGVEAIELIDSDGNTHLFTSFHDPAFWQMQLLGATMTVRTRRVLDAEIARLTVRLGIVNEEIARVGP
jgi:hypothetical protein